MSNINVSFFCVQPIRLDDDIYTKVLLKKTPFAKIDEYTKPQMSTAPNGWHKKYNHLYDAYRTLKEIKLDKTSANLLKDALSDEKNFAINHRKDTLPLEQFLNDKKTKYTLYIDTRFSYFILVYEIHFIFPKKVLNDFLDHSFQDNYDNRDLYNTIRNLIVKESNKSEISAWGESIRISAVNQIKYIITSTYHLKLAKADVYISNNSCNISCFIMDSNNNDKTLIEKFNELNKYAERLTSNAEIEKFYGETVNFSFNGRFHTIYLTNKQDELRFQPLQFHIQYMWVLVKRFNSLMNQINLELMQNDSMKNLKKYSDIIHIMINKMELLSLHDSNFKHSIEVDFETIYVKNEKKWSIMGSLKSSKQYVNFFKGYLDRLFSQKSDLFQKKQNYILIFISVIQIIALLSVWSDYLSLLDKNKLTVDERLLSIFQTTQNIMSFNVYLPIYLFVIIGLVILYLFFRKKN